MPAKLRVVTITGAAGTEVTIYPRHHGDPPPLSVFEGALNSEGRLKLLLPPAYFAVVHASGSTLPLEIEEQGPNEITLQLPHS